MKANIGRLDKLIRLAIAAALFFIYLRFSSGKWSEIILIMGALLMLITSLLDTCPLYSLLKISTRKKDRQHREGALEL
jgi:hypothetical protein